MAIQRIPTCYSLWNLRIMPWFLKSIFLQSILSAAFCHCDQGVHLKQQLLRPQSIVPYLILHTSRNPLLKPVRMVFKVRVNRLRVRVWESFLNVKIMCLSAGIPTINSCLHNAFCSLPGCPLGHSSGGCQVMHINSERRVQCLAWLEYNPPWRDWRGGSPWRGVQSRGLWELFLHHSHPTSIDHGFLQNRGQILLTLRPLKHLTQC